MKRLALIITLLVIGSLLVLTAGCEKERIVESTEIVREIEYVEQPPDTVVLIDTVLNNDSVTIRETDTVIVYDTIIQVDRVYDTLTIHDTVTVYDTTVTILFQYDTTVITDTVLTVQCDPNEQFAIAALQYYSDPLVILFINQQFGYTDGWILYLSSFQMDLTQKSPTVYDIYGYIDYWAPDWSGYYPLEFYWELVFTGGDPANPINWQMVEPSGSPPNMQPGIRLSPKADDFQRPLNR